MRIAYLASLFVVGNFLCATSSGEEQKRIPAQEAGFKQARITDVWEKYAGVLTMGKGRSSTTAASRTCWSGTRPSTACRR